MKHFFVIFVLISSCSQPTSKENKIPNDKLKSISISTYGGEMGYSQSLKITADSLYFDFNLAVDSTKRRNETKINNYYKLEDIISATQLIDFSKTIDGKSMQPVDGTDTKIVIETEQNKYSVINGENNIIWQKTEIKISGIINKEFGVE